MSDTTVYTLYPDVGTDARGRYFDGQFLTAQDFVDEQRYHVDRLRRVLDLMTTPGVARGLGLTATGPWLLRLDAGTALDDRGRLLVVTAARDNIPVPRDLPGGAADVSLFYAEIEARVQGGTSEEQGTRGATRLREVPALEFHGVDVAPKNAGAVRIGRLTVDANGAVTLAPPNTVRTTAGLRLPAEPDGGPTLRAGGGARPNLLQGTGDVAVSGKLAVGTLDPETALDVRGLARVDDLSVREHGFRVDGDEAQFYPVVFRDLDWTAGASVLELSRANAQADAANAGSLMARFRWHAADGQGADLLDCDIIQTRRFVAAARSPAKDRLLVVWLRGNRSYAWRGGQRTELVDARAIASKAFGGETLKPRADVDPAFDRDRVSLGVTYNNIDLRGTVSVAGDLIYSGTQSRLNVAEQASATIRAYDFYLGHSTRRGTPGRALVDLNKTILAVNFGADWPTLRLGGTSTNVEGSLAVAGDADLSKSLDVATTLTVGGAATLNGALVVAGDAALKKGLAVTGALSVGAGATITGDLVYSGTQSRLDAAEQSTATVRAADFYLGHSTRRGTPGRALVDLNKTTLSVNNSGDWATLSLGGTTTVVEGDLTANKSLTVTKNATVSGALTVAGATSVEALNIGGKAVITDADPFLQVQRPSGQSTGGTDIFLELVQQDVNPAKVPEVGVSLRFHHGHRFWHRIEGRSDGLHVRDGDPGSNAYKNLFAANIESNGMNVVTAQHERVRIVRGTVNASGSIINGNGFSVSKQGSTWKVTYTNAFADEPTVVATQQYPDNDAGTDSGNTRDNAVVVMSTKAACLIKTGDSGGDHSWRRFHFIAIGRF